MIGGVDRTLEPPNCIMVVVIVVKMRKFKMFYQNIKVEKCACSFFFFYRVGRYIELRFH